MTPDQIIQGLHISKDSNAEMTINTLQPNNDQKGTWYGYSHNMNGDFMKVTYSNITNSFYTDMNGVQHPIKKVEITYSNLISGNRRNNMDIWFRPADGTSWGAVDSFYIKSVDAKYDFYDENNQKIDFAPGSAWLFMSSLTRWANNNDGTLQVDPSQDHVEAVQALRGSKLYNIPGGKAKVHADGNAYADPTDAIQHREPYHPTGDGDNIYDHDGGAVLASVSNGMVLQWNIEQNYDPNSGKDKSDTPSLTFTHEDAKDGGWYYFTIKNDTLSKFSVNPPVRKTTSTHYHYNTSAIDLHFPNNIDDLSI